MRARNACSLRAEASMIAGWYMYGSLDLTRDKQGLAHARVLKALLDQAVQLLEADKALPDAVPPPAAARTVKNPFA